MVRLVLRTGLGMFDLKFDRDRARRRVIGGMVMETWETKMGPAKVREWVHGLGTGCCKKVGLGARQGRDGAS